MLNDPILITGPARSGTSLTAGLVYLSGAWGGELCGATNYNKKGQFENNEIREKLCKPYLERIGCDRLGQKPLPELAQLDLNVGWREKVVDILGKQGYPGGVWFYKGAKSCLMWPVWAEAFPEAYWLFVLRNPHQVVESCLATPFMRNRKTHSEWYEWLIHHYVCLCQMMAAGLNVTVVSSDALARREFTVLTNFLLDRGLAPSIRHMSSFVDETLWHKAK